MAAGANKPWSSLLLVALAAVMLIAAKPAAADAAAAAPYSDPFCSSKHLPDTCSADKFSNCKYVPFPFSLIWPSCSFQDKARDCCDALEDMSRHRCATCALLEEFKGVPQFDPATDCQNSVKRPAEWCKVFCANNPDNASSTNKYLFNKYRNYNTVGSSISPPQIKKSSPRKQELGQGKQLYNILHRAN
nr:unnamed protein product [Digitaria exilis]